MMLPANGSFVNNSPKSRGNDSSLLYASDHSVEDVYCSRTLPVRTRVAGELGVDELHDGVIEDKDVGRPHQVREFAVDDLQVKIGELQDGLRAL